MPLGDFFAPDPVLLCPLCAAPIEEWEGYGGPGAFLLFVQGQKAHKESRLASHDPKGEVTLPDGAITLFAKCKEQHSLLADAIVEDGVFVRAVIKDADGAMPLPLVGDFVLWRSLGSRYALSTASPTEAEGVVPASITAIGYNAGCILTTRRRDTRDPSCSDEWYFVDVEKREAVGPVPDPELQKVLAERGLVEPEELAIPEDVE